MSDARPISSLRKVNENKRQDLLNLIGEKVVLLGVNYLYYGVLTEVYEDNVSLQGARIVFETGNITDAKFKDESEMYSSKWNIMLSAVESFGGYKCDDKLMKAALKK